MVYAMFGVWLCVPRREMSVFVFHLMESSGAEYSVEARLWLDGMKKGGFLVCASFSGNHKQFIIIYLLIYLGKIY